LKKSPIHVRAGHGLARKLTHDPFS